MAMQFRAVLRRRDPALLMPWIDQARRCGLLGIQRFARTLLADLAAVRNAVSEPWSKPPQDDQAVDVRARRDRPLASPPTPVQSRSQQHLMRQPPRRAMP